MTQGIGNKKSVVRPQHGSVNNKVDTYKNLSHRLQNAFNFINIVLGWSKMQHDSHGKTQH